MINRLIFNGKYIILSTIITTLAILSVSTFRGILSGLTILIIYGIFFGYFVGQYFLPNEKKHWKIFLGGLIILTTAVILFSLIYWFDQINKTIIYLMLILLPLLISLQKIKEKDPFADVETEINLESYTYIKSHLGTKLLVILATCLDLLLFWFLWQKQYTNTLVSPWTIVEPKFFLLFFLNSLIIFWTLQKSKHTASNLFVIILHYSLILSVVLIIFKLGYGFDPFVHQATEKWIAEHGFITPKQPYYLGQYVLVTAIYFITHLDISVIDRILVPIGAGITIPLISYFAFSRTGHEQKLLPALMTIPILPLIFFNNTSPNNLALLIALIITFWIWYERQNGDKKTHLIGLILSLTACTIHPFVGLPILVIYFFSIIIKYQWFKKTTYPIYVIILTLVLPLAFYFNSLRQGQYLKLNNPLNNLSYFWEMFHRPFYYWMNNGSWTWKLLYYYRDALIPLILIAIVLGLIICWKKYKNNLRFFSILTSASLFVSAFIISTVIQFTDVIEYEQNMYAHRLLELALISLIPYLVISTKELFILLRRQPGKQLLGAIFFSALLLISWYFTYPTRDPISHYTGFNIRQADIDVVNFIMNKNLGQTDYIVLTNQAVATAALKEFGFIKYLPTPQGEQYFYSIPTGGPLYQYFRKMVYEEPKRQWMEEAMKFAGVKKAYFIHTNYWAPAAEIRDAAKAEADNWWELSGGRVWVYEYLLKD